MARGADVFDVIAPPPTFVQLVSRNPIAIVVGLGAMAIGIWALTLASNGARSGASPPQCSPGDAHAPVDDL